MRPVRTDSPRYVAGIVPKGELHSFLVDEFARIQTALNGLADGYLEAVTVAPAKPRDGMLRRADGVSWDPGSGAGVYCYYGANWHYLG